MNDLDFLGTYSTFKVPRQAGNLGFEDKFEIFHWSSPLADLERLRRE
jgi:hypothetical protein